MLWSQVKFTKLLDFKEFKRSAGNFQHSVDPSFNVVPSNISRHTLVTETHTLNIRISSRAVPSR